MAYILALLREPTANGNESSILEEEEDESDVEDGDVTMLNTEVPNILWHHVKAIYVIFCSPEPVQNMLFWILQNMFILKAIVKSSHFKQKGFA